MWYEIMCVVLWLMHLPPFVFVFVFIFLPLSCDVCVLCVYKGEKERVVEGRGGKV